MTNQGTNEPLLPLVLEALHEIAFKPKFLASRVEKERRAVLSELQMMNTIEYRVDCQLLQQLHSENMLGYRFPIGLEEQIKKWDPETIKAFHERWYFPANATLFIVGDIGSVSRTLEMIEAQFGSTPAGVHASTHMSHENINHTAITVATRKERHSVRPPVRHTWSLPGTRSQLKKPFIFQHELLQNFSISLFCKTPVQNVQRYSDLRDVLMRRIVLSTFQFRVNTRYKSANPPFSGIELDHSDSGREGCAVSTLTITAEPKHWEGAIRVGVQEVRRLHKFGVTRGELARYLTALLKDSEHLAAMIDNVPSVDNLDFIMESDALGHTVMDQQQGHESLLAVAETVTLEDVNKAGAAMLEYIATYGQPTAPIPAAIVACVPKTIHLEEVGDVSFDITPDAIVNAITGGLDEPLASEPELEVPTELVSPMQLASLHMQWQPRFVAVTDVADAHNWSKYSDEATGVVQRRLSNGIRVNYKITQNEAKGGVLRLVVAGGRAQEKPGASGAVAVGVRTLSEGGAVGSFSREQVELFCVGNLINCVLEADEEFLCMDFRFTLRDGGMRATFQLLHMVLEHNVWLEDALDRAKQLYLSHYHAMPKSLERATAHRLMRAMFNGEERFIEPSPQAIEKLTLPVVREAVMQQLVPSNMEVCVVGDFSEEEVESCLLDYLGTLTVNTNDHILKSAEVAEKPVLIDTFSTPEQRHQRVRIPLLF
jgi:predicted Zn-dependent peptidase